MTAANESAATPEISVSTPKTRYTWLKLLKPTHHWVGASLSVVLLISALTGAALAFRPQVDPLVYPTMLTASTCSQPISVDQVVANAVTHHPQSRVSYVRVQNRPLSLGSCASKIGMQFISILALVKYWARKIDTAASTDSSNLCTRRSTCRTAIY